MNRIVLALCLLPALLLSACNTTGGVSIGPQPVLESTIVDERVVGIMAVAIDASTTAINLAIEKGKITAGTPKAQRYARLLDDARNFANAAAEARTSATYVETMSNAARAFSALQAALVELGT